jgi:Ca2+-binding RTX toxin-like protein
MIWCGGGNDRIFGSAEADRLYGDGGDDVIDASRGNDYMEGNGGQNTYVLRKGSGQDRINNFDSDTKATDTLRFENLVFSDLAGVARRGNDLVIAYGESDTVTIINHFLQEHYRIANIEFSDGAVLASTALELTGIPENWGQLPETLG